MAQDSITVTGIEHLQEAIKKMRTDNPSTKKELQSIIRHAIAEAKKNIVKDAQDILPNDPRHAYKAVRYSVYKQLLGGQVNILSAGHRGAPTGYRKPTKQRSERARGGNRRQRSRDTMRIDSYEGVDRAFILRFQNAGTSVRETRYGKRGSLRARHWFGTSSAFQMQGAAEKVVNEIENLLQQEFQMM